MMVRELLDCAQTFDLEQGRNTEDIAFFIEIARRAGGPLLELGCGAGRLAIPLARSGVEVIALDISVNMLECFNRRLEREPPSVRSRIKLIRADMRRFALKRRFRGAILSSNTLLLLASEKSVGQALACVGSHLAPDGEIIIDVAAIDGEVRTALMEYPREDVPDLMLHEEFGDGPLRRTHSVKPAADANCFAVRYRYFDSHGALCAERCEDLVLLTPEELLCLLQVEGYEILEKFGWYDCRGFSERQRKLIVVARKREQKR